MNSIFSIEFLQFVFVKECWSVIFQCMKLNELYIKLCRRVIFHFHLALDLTAEGIDQTLLIFSVSHLVTKQLQQKSCILMLELCSRSLMHVEEFFFS